MMLSYLEELYRHQEWADAEHWRQLEVHAAALADRAIRERLHHIYLVQLAFLWVIADPSAHFAIKKIEDYPRRSDLKTFAQKYHAEMAAKMTAMDQSRLQQTVQIPWFQPPLPTTVRQALMQAAMHSHYHRGQNATRMRELGVVPAGYGLY